VEAIQVQIAELYRQLQAQQIPQPAQFVEAMHQVTRGVQLSLYQFISYEDLRTVCVQQLRDYVNAVASEKKDNWHQCLNYAEDQANALVRLLDGSHPRFSHLQRRINKLRQENGLSRR
jgi:predicted nucleic acid-binding OB-fold protein